MNPGELNKRIIIQKNEPIKNAIGGWADNWVDVCTVWASIEPLQGKELMLAQQVNSNLTVKIRIRYRPGIDSSMRVLYKGNIIYNIVSPPINVKGANVELQLMCEQRQVEQNAETT